MINPDKLKVGDEVYHSHVIFSDTHTIRKLQPPKKFKVVSFTPGSYGKVINLEEMPDSNNPKKKLEKRSCQSYSGCGLFGYGNFSDSFEEITRNWNATIEFELKELENECINKTNNLKRLKI